MNVDFTLLIPEFILAGSYEIEIAAERFSATAGLRPPYDPRSKRVRA